MTADLHSYLRAATWQRPSLAAPADHPLAATLAPARVPPASKRKNLGEDNTVLAIVLAAGAVIGGIAIAFVAFMVLHGR